MPDDAVQRILDAEVPDSATTADEIRRAVGRSNRPQTSGNAAVVADRALTEEDVMQLVQQRGEVPTEAELGSMTAGAEGVADEQRRRAVEQQLSEQVATREDVETAVQEAVEAGRQERGSAFREDVERGVDSVDREVVGEVDIDELAQQAGAPDRQAVQREAAQVVAQSDSVEVTDTLTADTIRDSSGEPVAVVGRQAEAQEAADELGVDALSPSELQDELGVRGRGSTVDVTLRGRKVSEVDV